MEYVANCESCADRGCDKCMNMLNIDYKLLVEQCRDLEAVLEKIVPLISEQENDSINGIIALIDSLILAQTNSTHSFERSEA